MKRYLADESSEYLGLRQKLLGKASLLFAACTAGVLLLLLLLLFVLDEFFLLLQNLELLLVRCLVRVDF